MLTATGDLSRNRQAGLRLAQGESVDKITATTHMAIEGIKTTAALYELANEHGVDMPIVQAVYRVLYENMPIDAAVRSLFERDLRVE
jgi:glycerol-3-phosphate dehydrogenase (NAD(P)+)